MKKISFKFEEQVGEDTWRKFNGVDHVVIKTDLTDQKELLSLVQDSIDYNWNSRLRSHENPRRVTEIAKVEDYVPKKNYDNYDLLEDDDEEFEEIYD